MPPSGVAARARSAARTADSGKIALRYVASDDLELSGTVSYTKWAGRSACQKFWGGGGEGGGGKKGGEKGGRAPGSGTTASNSVYSARLLAAIRHRVRQPLPAARRQQVFGLYDVRSPRSTASPSTTRRVQDSKDASFKADYNLTDKIAPQGHLRLQR